MDPESALGGPKPISRTGIVSPLPIADFLAVKHFVYLGARWHNGY